MSSCPPTRRPSSDRPACWVHCTSNSRPRPTRRREGRLHEGSLIPLKSAGQVPEHRADAGRRLAAAQRWWDRPHSGHHRGVQHRLGRPRSRPAQPDRAARRVHRLRERPKGRHHRRQREPEQSGRPVRRAEAGGGQGITHHPRRPRRAEGSARTTSPRRSRSWASSARWPPIRSTRPRKPSSRSSKTLGRCWNSWPTRVPRSPGR